MTITLTKQEISDLTISCETMMEQLNDDIQDYGEGFARPQQERIWDLRNKLTSENKAQAKQLILSGVSQQRELLLDFWMKMPKTHKHKGVAEHYIDNYLKSNNCA